jgi:hypothetical protein
VPAKKTSPTFDATSHSRETAGVCRGAGMSFSLPSTANGSLPARINKGLKLRSLFLLDVG